MGKFKYHVNTKCNAGLSVNIGVNAVLEILASHETWYKCTFSDADQFTLKGQIVSYPFCLFGGGGGGGSCNT